MNQVLEQARQFLFGNARLLERRIFEVLFDGASPQAAGQAVRAYQNADGGLGHALEPDVRCPESQPIFVSVGLGALEEAGCRDAELSLALCAFLQSVSAANGYVPLFSQGAYRSPIAAHWVGAAGGPGLNPTAEICGLLHFQRVSHEWLELATAACVRAALDDPPKEAHALCGIARLAQYLPDRAAAMNIVDSIARALPRASFYIAEAPALGYGLTPLHFAPRPDSLCRGIFSQSQMDGHIEDLLVQQREDGGWPITWDATGPAAEAEWRGRFTLDALGRLSAYGAI